MCIALWIFLLNAAAMPNAFNFSALPFNSLTQAERTLLGANLDIVYFTAQDVILEADATTKALFVVIKGHVAQMEDDETVHIFGTGDTFDARALAAGRSSHRFIAQDEVLAYAIDAAVVQTLIADNATFSALLFADLGKKLSTIAQHRDQHAMRSLALSRLDATNLHPPHYVDYNTSLTEVAHIMHTQRTSHVLVRDTESQPQRLGIFSTADLPRAINIGLDLSTLAVGDLATFGLITLRPEDPMGDALTTMLRHRIHRIVVADGEDVLGTLESLDVFSFLSNHSHLILSQIEQSQSIEDLAHAAEHTTSMVQLLSKNGTDIGLIGRLVHEINLRLIARTWQLTATPELVENSCLLVLGSEARGEQLFKTDQDNALIVADNYTDEVDATCAQFSENLGYLGYPPCPGNIMVNNPAWRGTTSSWKKRLHTWQAKADNDSLMHLAIFQDAQCACGNETLLQQVQQYFHQTTAHNELLLHRFAAPAVQFTDSTSSWLSRILTRDSNQKPLNIKKSGIFPIVHGIRSLALSHGIQINSSSTMQRIDALIQAGALQRDFGEELIHTLHFFMRLRLQHNLQQIEQGVPLNAKVDLRHLTAMERDLLKDTLGVVRNFKDILSQRFKLDMP